MAPKPKRTARQPANAEGAAVAAHAPPIDWPALYRAADALQALAPWEWMDEQQMFAVEDPAGGPLGICSLMGALGEHIALAVYRGAAGLRGLQALAEAADAAEAQEAFSQQDLLMLSYEARSAQSPADLRLIKELGLKYRGLWPLFRSQRPGYLPWHLDADEAAFLLCAIQQTLEVTPRLREDEDAVGPDDEGRILCRVRRAGRWQDEWVKLPEPGPGDDPAPVIAVDDLTLAQLKRHAAGQPRRGAWQIECATVGGVVAEPGKRPFPTVLLLIADEQSGFIIGIQVLSPTAADRYADALQFLVQQFLTAPMVPAKLQVRRDDVRAWVTPLAQALGVPVEHNKTLRAAQEALRAFAQRFG